MDLKHNPTVFPTSYFLACRGVVIGTMRATIENRQSNTMQFPATCAIHFPETDSSACLGSCVLEGVAESTTEFFFTSCFSVLNRNNNSIC